MIPVHSINFTDGVRFVLDTVHRTGADAIVTKLDGWFGVPARTGWESLATDGVYGDVLWREGRRITLGVTETLPDRAAVEDRARQVSAVFLSGERGNGTLTVDGITGPLSCLGLALDGEPKAAIDLTNLIVHYEIPMMSPDAYLYGPEQSGQVATADVGIGLRFPWFTDGAGNITGQLEFGEAVVSGVELTNTGNVVAYPVITVAGDMGSGFRLRLSGDGPDGGWGVAYQAGVTRQSPVTVDMSGRILVDGNDRSLLATERHWGGVEPGGSVSVRLEPLGTGDGWADVSLRPAYL